MTPEEEAGLLESGKTQEEVDAQIAAEAMAAETAAAEAKAKAEADKEALLSGLAPEDVEKTPHFRKMAYALREEMRQKEAERVRTEQENQRLKEEAAIRAKVGTEDPEQLLTVGEFNKRVDHKVAQLTKDAETKRLQEEAVSIQIRLAESEKAARERYSVEKAGAGLDYDSVFAATQRQIADNPAYVQVILKAKDPAAEAYRIGLLDPAIQLLREQKQTEVTLAKIKTGGLPPKGGGGGAPNTAEDLSLEELINLPPGELEKRTLALG